MIHFRLTNVEFELTDSVSHRSGKDTRPRSDRTELAQKAWDDQRGHLVDAYLLWRHEAWQPRLASEISHGLPAASQPDSNLPPIASRPLSDRPPGQGDFSMECVDTFGKFVSNFATLC